MNKPLFDYYEVLGVKRKASDKKISKEMMGHKVNELIDKVTKLEKAFISIKQNQVKMIENEMKLIKVMRNLLAKQKPNIKEIEEIKELPMEIQTCHICKIQTKKWAYIEHPYTKEKLYVCLDCGGN